MKKIAKPLLFLPLFLLLAGCEHNNTVESSLEYNKRIAEAYVHSYATALGEILPMLPSDSLRIAAIRAGIQSIRFYPDSSGYFYVYDTACINIAHARQPDLPGSNLYDHKDSKGKYVIRELLSAAQAGGGYVEFFWIKPGGTGEKRKLGYVEMIPNTNYFIGSGVYLE